MSTLGLVFVVIASLLAYEAIKGLHPAAAVASGSSGPSGPSGGSPAPGGSPAGLSGYVDPTVTAWVHSAADVLRNMGYSISPVHEQQMGVVVMNEGGANPRALSGGGAIGPAQVIPDTFKGTGFQNIYDPVQNIAAGMKYGIDRYGSISQLPGVISLQTGKPVIAFPGANCANHPGYGLYCVY